MKEVTITKTKRGFNVQHNLDPLTGKPWEPGEGPRAKIPLIIPRLIPEVRTALINTDWTLLRNQKATLISVIGYLEDNLQESEGSPDVPKKDILHLEGLLNFLDALQDAAKLDGYPVKFLTQVPAKAVKRGQ